jgi:ABC-type glutathione transport system ATPase component
MTLTNTTPSDSADARPGAPLLEVDHLIMHYHTEKGPVYAVEDVSFTLEAGEALGLVGESGCGKTSVAMALLRLQAENAEFKGGEIRLKGQNLLAISESEMRTHRWSDISMVFQGAMNAWNPVYRVGDQIQEAMDLHFDPPLTKPEAWERMAETFKMVGLDPLMLER